MKLVKYLYGLGIIIEDLVERGHYNLCKEDSLAIHKSDRFQAIGYLDLQEKV